MSYIFYLMGKSSSGKDTLYKKWYCNRKQSLSDGTWGVELFYGR